MWPCILTNFFIIKPNRCTNFTNLFWCENLHVLNGSSVHRQEFIHCTLSNGMCHRGFRQLATGPGWNHPGPAPKLSTNLYDMCIIAECTVNKLLMMDRGTQSHNQDGTILVLLQSCLQPCMTCIIAECTLNKLLMMDRITVQTCRVSCQNKFVKWVHLFGFIVKKRV